MITLSAVIITKNAEKALEETLKSLSFAGEIVVVDENSTDKTIDIAMKYTDKIITTSERSFAKKRNLALKACQADWIFYVDSDEVVTKALKEEISGVIENNDEGIYTVRRENYFLGTKMYPDQVERLFWRENLRGWSGEIHESPITTGNCYTLANPLIHHSHRDITSMLEKTNEWSEIEADLRMKAKHPPMAWWRLIRVALTEGWHQFGKIKVGRYGRAGLFEGCFQVIDKLTVYIKLWERQH